MPSLTVSFLPLQGPIIELGIAFPRQPQTMRKYRALVDTGAFRTSISPAVVADLGLPRHASGLTDPIGTAKGPAEAEIYVAEITVLFPGSPPFVIVQNVYDFTPLPGASFEVLLGLDIICAGKLTINGDQMTLELP